jgi:tetratricopeptide (TPR) repeat protein
VIEATIARARREFLPRFPTRECASPAIGPQATITLPLHLDQKLAVVTARMMEQRPSNASLRDEYAALRERLGSTALAENRLDEARKQLDALLDHARREAADSREPGKRRRLAVALGLRAALAFAEGRFDQASILSRQELALTKDESAEDPSCCGDLAAAHDRLGDIALEQGRIVEARAEYGRGQELRRGLSSEQASATSLLTASTCERLGNLAQAEGKLDEAYRQFDNARLLREAAVSTTSKPFQQQRALAFTYDRLGTVAELQYDTEGAHKFYSRGLELREALAELTPDNPTIVREVSISQERLALLEFREGNFDKAKKHFGGMTLRTTNLLQTQPENPELIVDYLAAQLHWQTRNPSPSPGAPVDIEQAFEQLELLDLRLSSRDARRLDRLRQYHRIQLIPGRISKELGLQPGPLWPSGSARFF